MPANPATLKIQMTALNDNMMMLDQSIYQVGSCFCLDDVNISMQTTTSFSDSCCQDTNIRWIKQSEFLLENDNYN